MDRFCHEFKVVGPQIDSRVEQPNDLTGVRIDGTQIAAFVLVASNARVREIRGVRLPAMLFRDDVIDPVSSMTVGLGCETVFAPIL